jgi:hypothetical protein
MKADGPKTQQQYADFFFIYPSACFYDEWELTNVSLSTALKQANFLFFL